MTGMTVDSAAVATAGSTPTPDAVFQTIWHMPYGWELTIWIAVGVLIALVGLTASAWRDEPEINVITVPLAILWPIVIPFLLPVAIVGYPIYRAGRWYWQWVRRQRHNYVEVPKQIAARLRGAPDPDVHYDG